MDTYIDTSIYILFQTISRMCIHLLVLFLSIYGINSHGQHGSNHQALPGGNQPHVSRKMEDYVHDKKYLI